MRAVRAQAASKLQVGSVELDVIHNKVVRDPDGKNFQKLYI
jgi:hypothetical protein